MLLKVHQSNFRIVGFTAEASLAELATLARARGLILMDDLGSGTLAPLPGHLAPLEPTVRESLAAGSDIVAFSGDKLLGGPQAGLLAGRADLVDRLRRHPLLRALRTDKLTLAALEATLRLHADPARAAAEIPVLRRLAQTPAILQARAEALGALVGAVDRAIVATTGHVGGGALPSQAIPSFALAVSVPGLSPDELAYALRTGEPAIAARIHKGRLLLDMLTLDEGDLPEIARAIARIAP
jgi:L-seryl-tRNA(Ser) seleniumtransferase